MSKIHKWQLTHYGNSIGVKGLMKKASQQSISALVINTSVFTSSQTETLTRRFLVSPGWDWAACRRPAVACRLGWGTACPGDRTTSVSEVDRRRESFDVADDASSQLDRRVRRCLCTIIRCQCHSTDQLNYIRYPSNLSRTLPPDKRNTIQIFIHIPYMLAQSYTFTNISINF